MIAKGVEELLVSALKCDDNTLIVPAGTSAGHSRSRHGK